MKRDIDFLLLVVLILTACTPSPPEAAPTHTPAPTTAPTDAPIPTITPDPSPTNTPRPTPVYITSAEALIGVWHGTARAHPMYIRFNEDGTCFQSVAGDMLDTNPNVICEYYFEDGLLHFIQISVRDLPDCGPDPYVYEVHQLEDGKIRFVALEDSCRASPEHFRDASRKIE